MGFFGCFKKTEVSHVLMTTAVPRGFERFMTNVRIWDLPTRLFHWTLALCVAALVITGNIGGEAMVWHFRFGFAVLALLFFRLVWGFCGGRWSRWSQLPIHPTSLLTYLRSSPAPLQAGHSPLGSLSVLALLLMLLFQVASGLISDDEIATAGPFVPWVSSALSAMATHWHTSTGKSILLLLIALHLAAIWYYRRFKKQALTQAMLLGDQRLSGSHPPSRDDARSRGLALFLFCICAGLVFALSQMAP
jgi:cytochrome b